ncbi:hypothetical protein ACGF3G_29535 [Streptomyces sp. NPDC048179]|uniref:hypothetical protein n=1 Tax=Streptomyces sp. NPDC048179 TaxID=3365506 RepID=UPI003715B9EB
MATSRAFRHIACIPPGAMVLGPAMSEPAAETTDTASAEAIAVVHRHSGSPASAVDHVADFYGAYTDVLHDAGHYRLTDALRRHYLTAELRHSLKSWEAAHQQDGVLHAKGVPTRWSLEYNDSGMGHCWSRVSLTWNDTGKQKYTIHLVIQSDLATRLISGIRVDG